MREETTIRISQTSNIDTEDFLNAEYIYFDQLDSESKLARYLGKPLSIESDQLSIKTQIHLETALRVEIRTGSQVLLYKDWHKNMVWANGEISSIKLIPTRREDWKITQEIEPSHSDELTVDINLNQQEKEALELGLIPGSMDDKWFIYCQNNTFHFIRSWSGIEIFRGKFIRDANSSGWKIRNILASKEWRGELASKKGTIERMLNFHIQRRLPFIEK